MLLLKKPSPALRTAVSARAGARAAPRQDRRGWSSVTPDPRVAAVMATLILATEVLFATMDVGRSIEVLLAGAAMSVALLVQLTLATPASMNGPAAQVVLLFDWLFLDVAPKVQLIASPRVLVNTSTARDAQIAQTMLVCAVFVLAYSATAYFIAQRRVRPSSAAPASAKAATLERVPSVTESRLVPAADRGLAIMAIVFVAMVAVALGLRYALHSDADVSGNGPMDMVMRKFVLFLPSASLLVLVDETIRYPADRKFSRYAVLVLLALLVLMTENPVTEKRNALGSIYITLILVAFPKITSSDWRRFLLLMVGMVVVFPAAALYTHTHRLAGVAWADIGAAIADHYLSTHYDAWANIYTALEMQTRAGLEGGKQLLGSVLFFVPSSLWEDKPQASGIAIGNYLIRNYAMWFNNLSAPLVAEAVLDFGPLGVLPYGMALACVVKWLDGVVGSAGSARAGTIPLACFLSVFVMFLLRGSLMIAFAYGAGSCAAFLTIRTILEIPAFVRGRWLRVPESVHAART